MGELNAWPGRQDPMAAVASKTKAALTRTYNKESHMTPYANEVSVKKSKKPKVDLDYEDGPLLGEDVVDGENESDDDDKEVAAVLTKAKKATNAKEGGGGKGKGSKTAT